MMVIVVGQNAQVRLPSSASLAKMNNKIVVQIVPIHDTVTPRRSAIISPEISDWPRA